MEDILKNISSGNEDSVRASLLQFTIKNAANFNLGETSDTRKEFCSTLLSCIGNASKPQWAPKTIALALTALKIFAREKEGIDDLISQDGLLQIVTLANLNKTEQNVFDYDSEERCEVLVEAVKCLCNVLLNNRYLAGSLDQLGCMNNVLQRLGYCHCHDLPYQLVQFDLRLLFLITACGSSERVRCREECNGILTMVNLVDSLLFGPSGQKPTTPKAVEPAPQYLGGDCGGASENGTRGSKGLSTDTSDESIEEHEAVRSKKDSSIKLRDLAPMRETVYCLPSPINDKICLLLHDALKILFNQTLGWADKDCEGNDYTLCTHLAHLLRILLVSVPPVHTNKAAMQTIVHTIEVLVNLPEKCAYCLLIPPHVQVAQSLCKLYPNVITSTGEGDINVCSTSGASVGGDNYLRLYKSNIDQIHDGWNMAAIVSLLNFLDQKLSGQIERHSLSPVLTALRVLSKGHRNIRRFLKAEILPPLHEVKERPDEGDSLKSRMVRLMVAGTHGAEEVTAELLFVLCKENANRLVKHTGYGNAAGLLLARGLLAGGVAPGSESYSSDSETSDTEEYEENKSHIDPVTGGPAKEDASPLDEMTPEEKEKEAEKLEGLLKKLDKHGIIKMMPLDQHNQPLRYTEESDSNSDEAD